MGALYPKSGVPLGGGEDARGLALGMEATL